MNFEFQNPTRLIFGAGNLARLGEVVKEKGKRALLVPGMLICMIEWTSFRGTSSRPFSPNI